LPENECRGKIKFVFQLFFPPRLRPKMPEK
jgi:hypothetical protein